MKVVGIEVLELGNKVLELVKIGSERVKVLELDNIVLDTSIDLNA